MSAACEPPPQRRLGACLGDNHRALQVRVVAALAAQRIARRVTGAAMAEAIDEFGAALPLHDACGLRNDRPGLQVDCIPQRHQCSLVEGESQRGLRRLVCHRGRVIIQA